MSKSGGKTVYWESPEELTLIQKRRDLRQKLRNEFNRMYYNPHRQAQHIEMLDPSVSRYTAMRASIFEHWKPNWGGFFRWILITFIPITALAAKMKSDMIEYDRKCRNGEIPYDKRDFRRL